MFNKKTILLILSATLFFLCGVKNAEAAISFVNCGTTVQDTRGNVSMGAAQIPSGIQNNDILILIDHQRDNVNSSVAGWTNVVAGNGNSTNRLEIFWKRTTGTESNFTINHTRGSNSIATICAFRGVFVSGSPFDNVGLVQGNASSPISTAAIATASSSDMILHAFGSQDNNTWETFSGLPTIQAFQSAFNRAGNNDSSAGLTYGLQTSAGSTGVAGASQVALGPDAGVSVLLALRPEPPITTTTILGSSATSSVYGNLITFTATITTASDGPATGTVIFRKGSTTIGTGILSGNPGVATFSTSTLSVFGSPYSITAVYNGNASFGASTSTVLSQTITPKVLTVTSMTALDKTYDATTTATLSGGILIGIVGSDAVSIASRTGHFSDKNAGINKSVIVDLIILSGTDAENYIVTNPVGITANILAKTLTVTEMTAADKIYDDTTNVVLSGGTLVGIISPDVVFISTRTGAFVDKFVGTNKPIMITSIALVGADAGNYTAANPTGITASIFAGPVNASVSTVDANPATIVADGVASSTINVTLKDAYGNPVSGKTVSLAQTSGPGTATIIEISAITDSSGESFFTVSSITAGDYVFTATDVSDSLSIVQTASVTFSAEAVSASASLVSASPSTVLSDGVASSTVTVILRDTHDNLVSGKTVTLEKTSGPGTPTINTIQGVTDSSGTALFEVMSITAGECIFTATDVTDGITITETADVTFVAGAVSASVSTVDANPATIVADGVASSTINVTLKDAYGNPVSGKTVSLAQTSGPGTATITIISDITNASGTAIFKVSSITAGTNVFTATDVSDSLVVTDTASVIFAVEAVSDINSTVSALPTSVLANSTSTSAVTVVLKDTHDNLVSGKTVTLEKTSGPGTPTINTIQGVTDSSGTALFEVMSITAGECIFTATDVTDGLVILQTASIQFLSTGGEAKKIKKIPLEITLSGKAYPGAQVSLYEKTPSSDNFVASSLALTENGDFTIQKIDVPANYYDFFLQVKDKDNRLSQIQTYRIDLVSNKLVAKNVLISPTIDLNRFLITRGDFLSVFGYAVPRSRVTITIDDEKTFNVDAGEDGIYKLLINTAEFDYGSHNMRARQFDPKIGIQSDFSPTINFILLSSPVPAADLNNDGQVDVQDWSAFLILWQNKDKHADLNNDGKVDIQDWSILLRSVKI